MAAVLVLFFAGLLCSISLSYGYDPLDPNGNVTITWDFLVDNGATFDVKVSIKNCQLFRHIEEPGWRLSWAWEGKQVIWNMVGAEATEQGNCSQFKGGQLPHCCEKTPVIVDLMPGTPYNMQVSNCCRGGVLTSMTQDPSKYLAAFQMNIAKPAEDLDPNLNQTNMPVNFSLGVPGYTCGDPFQVPPTKFSRDGGRRWTQVLETWNVVCEYSQFRAAPAPKCCVSLSSFYNSTIVPCPLCSCGCQGLKGAPKCIKSGEAPPFLQLPPQTNAAVVPQPVLRCTHHMCPTRVHWHVKQNYKEYWRVKVTITNMNFAKNYSQWNLVVLHPNLESVTEVFSFNYQPLNQYGHVNDTGMFWGVQFYNEMLLEAGNNGNVQSEILLKKDPSTFSFRDGWAFPRRISFNGDNCVMPPPDDYPRLPNSAFHGRAAWVLFLLFLSSAFLII